MGGGYPRSLDPGPSGGGGGEGTSWSCHWSCPKFCPRSFREGGVPFSPIIGPVQSPVPGPAWRTPQARKGYPPPPQPRQGVPPDRIGSAATPWAVSLFSRVDTLNLLYILNCVCLCYQKLINKHRVELETLLPVIVTHVSSVIFHCLLQHFSQFHEFFRKFGKIFMCSLDDRPLRIRMAFS